MNPVRTQARKAARGLCAVHPMLDELAIYRDIVEDQRFTDREAWDAVQQMHQVIAEATAHRYAAPPLPAHFPTLAAAVIHLRHIDPAAELHPRFDWYRLATIVTTEHPDGGYVWLPEYSEDGWDMEGLRFWSLVSELDAAAQDD